MRSGYWISDLCSSDLDRDQSEVVDRSIGVRSVADDHAHRSSRDPQEVAVAGRRAAVRGQADVLVRAEDLVEGSRDAGDVLAVGHTDQGSTPGRQARGRGVGKQVRPLGARWRSEEHTSELQSLMRHSYAVFCL